MNDCVDEIDCWQLELNECADNEFSCRNVQCILLEIYNNLPLIGCIDESDTQPDDSGEPMSNDLCYVSQDLHCEDIVCSQSSIKNTLPWSCGDGSCLDYFPSLCWSCKNGRNIIHIKSMFKQSGNKNSKLCWESMICSLKLDSELFPDVDCTFLYHKIIKSAYPTIIIFPNVPIIYHHVYFIYNITRKNDWTTNVPPNFICYDARYCDVIIFNNLTCINFTTEIED
ncbi:unnamed protein product [Rotaria sp. Silwood1]|nr:unnamed protein product [Rotaria sp. Silwood1]CAF1587955.1 unnamed protein product [Rotaria sp. Silwood1]